MLTSHPTDQRRAAMLMLVSVALFSLMDAGLKTLSAHYPPFQVAALRGLSSLPIVLAFERAQLKRSTRIAPPP